MDNSFKDEAVDMVNICKYPEWLQFLFTTPVAWFFFPNFVHELDYGFDSVRKIVHTLFGEEDFYIPKNHGISKLLVWRSNPAIQSQTPLYYRRVEWLSYVTFGAPSPNKSHHPEFILVISSRFQPLSLDWWSFLKVETIIHTLQTNISHLWKRKIIFPATGWVNQHILGFCKVLWAAFF